MFGTIFTGNFIFDIEAIYHGHHRDQNREYKPKEDRQGRAMILLENLSHNQRTQIDQAYRR